MTKIDPIDDYIEPQLIIQAKAKEIAAMTLKKDKLACPAEFRPSLSDWVNLYCEL